METTTKNKESKEKTNVKAKPFNVKELALGKKEVLLLDPRQIEVLPGFNSREDFGPMEILRASIKANGVLSPLTAFIKDGKVYVDQGHRRHRAVMELIEEGIEIKSIPVSLNDKNATETDRIFNQIVLNDGLPLKPVEEGAVYTKLINHGFSEKEIAERVGRSQSHVSQLLTLSRVPKEVKKLIIDDKISSSFVANMQRDLTAKAKVKAKEENKEIDLDKVHEQLKEKVVKAVEKAKAIGKNRATRAVVERGHTKKISKKTRNSEIIEFYKRVIGAIRSDDSDLKSSVIEEIETLCGDLLAGK